MMETTRHHHFANHVANKIRGDIKELVQPLNTKSKFVKLVQYSLECLHKLAVDEVSAELMYEEKTLDAVVKVLKVHPYNESVMQGTQCLQSMCKNGTLALAIAEKMSDLLIFSLNKHVQLETLMCTCTSILFLVRESAKAAKVLIQQNLVTSLQNLLKRSEDELKAIVLEILSFICNNSAGAKFLMKEEKLLTTVIELVKTQTENKTISITGISMLSKCAQSSPEATGTLIEMGIVDVTMKALEVHQEDSTMNETCTVVMSEIADGAAFFSSLDLASSSFTVNAQSQELVTKMSHHLLAEKNIAVCMAKEGLDYLLNAINTCLFETSEEALAIISNALRAIVRLAKDEITVHAIMQKGGIKTAAKVVQTHVDDPYCTAAAIQLSSACLTRAENAQYIIKLAGAKPAQAAYKAQPESELVAGAVLGFYLGCSKYQTSIDVILQPVTLQDLMQMLENRKSDSVVAKIADVVLNIGTNGSPEQVSVLLQSKLIPLLLEIMGHARDNTAVVESILKGLSGLVTPATVDTLEELSVFNAVIIAADANAKIVAIQELSSVILEKATSSQEEPEDSIAALARLIQQLIDGEVDETLISQLTITLGLITKIATRPFKPEHVDAWMKSFSQSAMDAMNNNIGDEEARVPLLLAWLQALGVLAKQQAIAAIVMSSGILTAVVPLASQYGDNTDVALSIAVVWRNVTAHTDLVPELSGQLERIFELCLLNIGCAKILSTCTSLVYNILKVPDSLSVLLELSTCDIVTENMCVNIKEAEEILTSIQVFNMINSDDSGAQKMVDAQGLSVLIDALYYHIKNEAIAVLGLEVLMDTIISEDVALKIVAIDGVETLLQMLRVHYKDDGVCEKTCLILESLVSVESNAIKMREPELKMVETLEWLISELPDNPNVKEPAENVLAILKVSTQKEQTNAMTEEQAVGIVESFIQMDDDGIDKLSVLLENTSNVKLFLCKGILRVIATKLEYCIQQQNRGLLKYTIQVFNTIVEIANETDVLENLEPADLMVIFYRVVAPTSTFALDAEDMASVMVWVAKVSIAEENLPVLLEEARLKFLVHTMFGSENSVLRASTCRLLGKVSAEEDGVEILTKFVDSGSLVATLLRNIADADFQKYAMFLVSNLADLDGIKQKLALAGGIQAILEVIKTHMEVAGVVENAFNALANLSFESQINSTFIVASEGIPPILQLLEKHVDEEDLLESGVCILCNVCHENNNNKDLTIKLNAPSIIVETILNNFDSVDLLSTCFRTLGNLAYDEASSAEVMKAGTVQGLVAGLTVHGDNDDLVDIGIRVLTNLAVGMSMDHQTIMAEEGAVQAVVEMCNSKTDIREVEISALVCLANLARADFNAHMIILQGGVNATISAMSAFNDDHEIVVNGLSVLGSLAKCTDYIDVVFEAGVPQFLVSIFKQHTNNRDIHMSCLECVKSICFNAQSAYTVGSQEGVLEMATQCLSSYVTEPTEMTVACTTMSSLSRSKEMSSKLTPHILEALGNILDEFNPCFSNLDCCISIFKLLQNLFVDGANAALATDFSHVRPVLTTMKQNPHDTVIMRGLRVLENMSFGSPDVRKLQQDEGAVEYITSLLSHPKDEIKHQAEVTLRAVTRKDLEDVPIADVGRYSMPVVLKKATKPKKVKTFDKDQRNFLIAGVLLQKHSKSAPPRNRLFSLTNDLEYFEWRDPKKNKVEESQRMKVSRIKAVQAGRCTPQLKRKNVFGRYLAKEDCCFAIFDDTRTIDLECKTEQSRDKLVDSINLLVQFIKEH